MIHTSLNPDIGANPWTDLQPVASGSVSRIGLLRNGMASGKASVAIVILTDDGQEVVGQMSWALFRTSFGALNASPAVAEEVIDP